MSLVDLLWHHCNNIKLRIISWVDNSWYSIISFVLKCESVVLLYELLCYNYYFSSQKGVWYERFGNSFGQFCFTVQLMDIYFTSLWCSRWDGVYKNDDKISLCMWSFGQFSVIFTSFFLRNKYYLWQEKLPIRKIFCHFSWVIAFSLGTLDPWSLWFIEMYWIRESIHLPSYN